MDPILSRERELDSAAEINPFKLPTLVWQLIEPYFSKDRRVDFLRIFPDPGQELDKPAISIRVARMRPGSPGGGAGEGVTGSRGPTYEHRSRPDGSGEVTETSQQVLNLTLDAAVFGSSQDQADDLAWDLFNALYDVVPILQGMVPGLAMAWSQAGEPAVPWRDQDKLKVRFLRYELRLPVRRKTVLPELRQILFEEVGGAVLETKKLCTRTSDEITFKVPVESGYRVTDIISIFLKQNESLKPLEEHVDYVLRLEDDRSVTIEWIDGPGLTPDPDGGEFVVDFQYAPLVRTRTITQRD